MALVNAIGLGDWLGAEVLLSGAPVTIVGATPQPSQPAPATSPDAGSVPTFRSGVTTIDPLWIVLALVVGYVLFRKG